jgi:DNA-binding response OmpR family regulator
MVLAPHAIALIGASAREYASAIKRANFRTGDPSSASLAIIDLPETGGTLSHVRTLRAAENSLLIMAIARDVQPFVLLHAGADDAQFAECNPDEIVARLYALLRRDRRQEIKPDVVEIGGAKFDRANGIVATADRQILLPPTQCRILEIISRSGVRGAAMEQMHHLISNDAITHPNRVLSVHLSKLRSVFTRGLGIPSPIYGHRRRGYRVETNSAIV